MNEKLTIGFLPLVDACLPILAQEHGFAEEEGLSLEFARDRSWATVLDRLLYGHSDAAHLVAPLAIATTLGRRRPAQPLSAPFALGLNGNCITFSNALAARLLTPGKLADPAKLGPLLKQDVAQLAQKGRKLRFGAVHRYSSHNFLLRYWLASCGIMPDRDIEMVTVAPPFIADALETGEVDGACAGEPWNSVAVERGAGVIALVTAQIWRRGVEKVLAMQEAVMEDKRPATEALIRAMIRAGKHFIQPENYEANAAILARPEYLDGSASIIAGDISDRLILARGTAPVYFPDFMFQYSEAANFPWVSQALWLYSQLIRWDGLDYNPDDAATAARVFRPDIYRSALKETDEPLPGASSKVEGSLDQLLQVSTQQGNITLSPNRFFDGKTFDPDHVQDYLRVMP
ncbi:MAG: CmpA/NrtA family ABC transporter substrate-binding protein [Sphingomonadaceae bacterium]